MQVTLCEVLQHLHLLKVERLKCHLIKLILTRNAFTFNEVFYLQQSGTAMGTCMALFYANLFIGKFEREFLRTQTALPLVWWRYIDDVFAIWTHAWRAAAPSTPVGAEPSPHINSNQS